MAEDPPYTIEFYADQHGRKPVLRWIEKDLSPTQRRALVMAIEQVLAYEGLDVVDSEFGKPTSEAGVHEFRLRQDEHELAARVQARSSSRTQDEDPDVDDLDDDAEEADDGEEDDQDQPEAKPRKKRGERVFLRVFFHAHGDKVILLLAGYDKGKNPSSRHESKVIKEAGKRLKSWRQQQQALRKAAKRKP